MRFLLLAFSVLGTASSAQTPPSVQPALSVLASAQATVLSTSLSSGCPVAFTARRTPGGALVQTHSSRGTHHLGFTLSFNTASSYSKAITEARVTLRGLAGAGFVPAGAAGEGKDTEALTFSPQQEREFKSESVVYSRKLTGVQAIELNELTFADGTEWHEVAENPCRIVPNGFMLVSASR